MGNPAFTVTVDKDKIHDDKQKAKDKANEIGRDVKKRRPIRSTKRDEEQIRVVA